jgi:hypothetical protein
MLLIYIVAIVEALVIIALITVAYRYLRSTNQRIESVEKNVKHLSTISKYFPDFIQKGERVTRNISEELTLKQNVLQKLISEAEKASERLGIVEQKIKENKLDKEMINKVLILVNQGFTPAEIAPKLNIPLGEIELVIKLRKYISSPIREKL